jgi:O-Antigen ligase
MQRRNYLPLIVSEMENPVTASPGALQRGRWASSSVVKALCGGLLGLVAIYSATQTEIVFVITAPLIIIAGGWLVVAAWRNWEFGLQALLVVLIIEGAVRKWFLPSASELVYFYKDLLMVVIVIGYLAKKSKSSFLIKYELKLFSLALVSFALYAMASISNPRLPHPLVGLLGVKAYLLYVPLAFLVPRMFTSKEKLVAFLKWYLVIALSVAALSAMQFADSNPNSTINRYAWDEKTAAASGMEMEVANFRDSAGTYYVRVTGPFSYLSGLAIYLPTIFALLLGLISQRLAQPLPKGFRWIYHIALASVVTTVFMTGSRGAVVNLGMIAFIFYMLASKKDLLRRLRQAAIGIVLVFIALTVFFPQAFDALYTRAFGGEEQVEEGQGRIKEAFRLPFDEAAYAGAFGYGIGATQNATPFLMSKLDLPFMGEQIPIYYENESGRVMLELGIVGYLLHVFLRFSILITLFYACFSIRDAESKSFAVAAVAALIFPLVLGGAVSQHTQNVYQWFLIGIPLAMLNADKLSGKTFGEAGRP